MSDFSAVNATDGFRVKVWHGESMCLLGFDVDEPEDDFRRFRGRVPRTRIAEMAQPS
jgi:hypothetical protein